MTDLFILERAKVLYEATPFLCCMRDGLEGAAPAWDELHPSYRACFIAMALAVAEDDKKKGRKVVERPKDRLRNAPWPFMNETAVREFDAAPSWPGGEK